MGRGRKLETFEDYSRAIPVTSPQLHSKNCQNHRVEHSTHPTSGEPIVITTDFLRTISTESGIRYLAISVKPEDSI
ncbi:TnsA endonuclease N-terminal domain-containing protein [Alteromonas sp. C1M14]|nr:TnsA endonuclease N-terminal domain-containing protein [Alteromonas sp. C1M14]